MKPRVTFFFLVVGIGIESSGNQGPRADYATMEVVSVLRSGLQSMYRTNTRQKTRGDSGGDEGRR